MHIKIKDNTLEVSEWMELVLNKTENLMLLQ